MFLHKVYKHSKPLAALMVLFVALQLFIGYKHGMVASPFLNYGMYSQQMNVEKNYEVAEVTVNGRLLRGADYTPQQWDRILLPVNYFANLRRSNELYENEVKRLLATVHLTTSDQQFLQTCDYPAFMRWYATYLRPITGSEVRSVYVDYRVYQYQHALLQPTGTVKSLASLCN